VRSSGKAETAHKESLLTWDYTTSAETQKLWDSNNEFCAKIMKEMGTIK
jgi:hypothetical protein